MNVEQLIAELQKYPPYREVEIELDYDYEWGERATVSDTPTQVTERQGFDAPRVVIT